MKRILLAITLVVLISGLVLSGCAAPAPAPKPAPAPGPAPAWKWPDNITILGPAVEQSRYAQTISVTPIMEQMTGTKIRVTPEENVATKQKWIREGKYLITVEGCTELAQAIQATSGHATEDGGPFQMRTIWHTQAASLGFMVTADSPIKTINDIKAGMRMPATPSLPATDQTYDALLAWVNLNRKDMTIVPFGDWASSCKALIDKKVDFTYGSTSASYAIEIAAGPSGVRWLELNPKKDPEGAKKFLAIKPTVGFGPAKTGVKQALDVYMLSIPTVMMTRAESDTELIYNFAKWLGENFNVYKDKHELNAMMGLDTMRAYLDLTYIPIHEGTIKYLKEKGLWTAADDARQKKNIALIDQYMKTYQSAIAEAKKKNITIEPKNKDWVDLWNSFKKDIPPVKVEL